MKDKKSLASLKGSFLKDGTITGRFKTNSKVKFTNKGFNSSLDKFDIKASYNIKNKSFKFIEGEGQLSISDIKGIKGSFKLGLKYMNSNFSAELDAKKSEVSFCGMTLSDISLKVEMDSLLNIQKIEGGFSVGNKSLSLIMKDVLIENGELKKIDAKANINYQNFKFDISKATYEDHTLTCSARVLLGKSYVGVDKFKIDKDGNISVGKVSGEIKKSLMSIKFNVAFSENRFKGSFDAVLSKKISIKGDVDMGSQTCSKCQGGSYLFGYYKLTVGAAIPLFAGISMSKLGGQFGYNYYIDFEKKKKYPSWGHYVAGFSFGIQDQAGLIELAVDPAVLQWNDKSASLDLVGTLKAPKRNPVFDGEAYISLKLPSYDISGYVDASVNIPPKTGWILKAKTKLNFTMTDRVKSFEVPELEATLLGKLKFKGNFKNTRTYNESGALISSSGYLRGDASLNFNYEYSKQLKIFGVKLYSIYCNFNFDFNSKLETTFNDQGIQTALFTGDIKSSGYIHATAIGVDINPYYSIEADATIKKMVNNNWNISGKYDFEIGIGSRSVSIDGEFNKNISSL